MKSQHFSVKYAGLLLALFCAFGITLASGTTAHAQSRNDDWRRHDQDHDRDWRRDRRERRREDERRIDQRSVNIYDRNRDGIDDRYERNRGYGTYGGYGNGGYGNYGYSNIAQIAQNQGYQAGLNTGASDAQRGQSYDPQRSHYYQNATYGYSSSYGNREAYKQYYRDGFQRGYQEGFRQYGGNGRYGRNYPNSRAGGILGSIFGRP